MASKKTLRARARRQLAAEKRYDHAFDEQDQRNQREHERWKRQVTRELNSR